MNKKINISLVGGQPFPVYAQILDNQPDIAILVCSKATRKYAENVKALIELKFNKIDIYITEISDQDNKLADEAIKAQCDLYCKPSTSLTVHVAGGTKPWAILYAKHFGGKATIVFIDQNNVIWNMDTLESHRLDSTSITIADVFTLQGVKISSTSFESFDATDAKCVQEIKQLRKCNFRAFNRITMDLSSHPNLSSSSSDACSISWNAEHRQYDCHFEYHGKFDKVVDKSLSSPHIKHLLLNTGWFEYEVASLLNHWPMTDQIVMNVNINYEGQAKTVNEIDIIVKTKHDKLLFVECKTQIFDSTAIDKFNDVVKKYGGLGSKRIFITEVPLKDLPKDKCTKSGIPHFSMQSILKSEQSRLAFFAQLDDYMSNINER